MDLERQLQQVCVTHFGMIRHMEMHLKGEKQHLILPFPCDTINATTCI